MGLNDFLLLELQDKYKKLQVEKDNLQTKLKKNKQIDYTSEEITNFIKNTDEKLKMILAHRKAINICKQLQSELSNMTYERDRWVEDYGHLETEKDRLKRDYELLEELSPPDIPREKFVKILLNCWRKQNQKENE